MQKYVKHQLRRNENNHSKQNLFMRNEDFFSGMIIKVILVGLLQIFSSSTNSEKGVLFSFLAVLGIKHRILCIYFPNPKPIQ
jgi:hypothetical protein